MNKANNFWVSGIPATFATRGEKDWKEKIVASLPGGIDGVGLSMQFVLPEHDGYKRQSDVDNYAEPAFSAVINNLNWMNGKRPNLLFWSAEKIYGSPTGMNISALSLVPERIERDGVIFDSVYEGDFPRGTKNSKVPEWIDSHKNLRKPGSGDCFAVRLQFASKKVNLGDIATGPVKSIIDGLYPLIGGTRAAPEDWRIVRLQVHKHDQSLRNGLRVTVANI